VGDGESVQHYSCESKCLLGTLPLNWNLSAGANQSRDTGRICWKHSRLHTSSFRLAYDRLVQGGIERADRDYVRLLHLAASISESEVETAIALLLETTALPTFDAVRDLVHPSHSSEALALSTPDLDLSSYDNLIPGSEKSCLTYPIDTPNCIPF
jgi:hypothetical protein